MELLLSKFLEVFLFQTILDCSWKCPYKSSKSFGGTGFSPPYRNELTSLFTKLSKQHLKKKSKKDIPGYYKQGLSQDLVSRW